MESRSAVRAVPPRKTLRDGQRAAVEAALEAFSKGERVFCAQLPTGYGKTLTAAAAFKQLRDAGLVDFVLYLVPTKAQLIQFCDGGRDDFADAGLCGEGVIPIDLGYSSSPAFAWKKLQSGSVVFAATIQAISGRGAASVIVRELLAKGRWLVVVDEYHHYALDKAWGVAVRELGAAYALAMSATPNRKDQNSAFGEPHVKVRYREAVREQAVKELSLHAYEYQVDAITVNGQAVSFTTSEVAKEAGSTDPQAIDKFVVDRKLRWSPKYVSPLVTIPIERLLKRRAGLPLQMIVGAMGCLHAQMVCEQIRDMFGDILRVDWVGTGPCGRDDKDNEAVLRKFCPPKRDGVRRPEDIQLDILVHVGMAGEGLDSIYVAEVVHLNAANLNNQNDQENGRAARRIPGAPPALQLAYINVDSSSPYATWAGSKIMDAFDRDSGEVVEEDNDKEERERPEDDDWYMPDEPVVVLADCSLKNIDRGDPEVYALAIEVARVQGGDSLAEHIDHLMKTEPDSAIAQKMLDFGIAARRRQLLQMTEEQNGRSALAQLRQDVSGSVGRLASLLARTRANGRVSGAVIGEYKRAIGRAMARAFGGKIETADELGLRARYAWTVELCKSLRSGETPSWLAS